MVRTEVLALGESRRQQLLPLSLSTEPAPDPTTWARVRAYFVVRRATSSFRWINDAKVKISSASCSAMSHSIFGLWAVGFRIVPNRPMSRCAKPRCSPWSVSVNSELIVSPNRKIFEARKRETAALGAGEKLVLGHPLAATIGDSARCMQNLEKVLFTGPKTSDTVTFICD